MIDFSVSKKEYEIIVKIAHRFQSIMEGMQLVPPEFQDILMDLSAVQNKNPLKLQELLNADGPNFTHDVGGIRKNLNRTTGELENCFVPRFSH